METKFQTSFIPKKTAAPTGMAGNIPAQHRSRSSLIMTFATVIFILSLGAAIGSYVWKYVLISNRESYKQQLVQRQEQFNLDLIEQLKQVNIKINMARQLMSNHIAVSQIFDVVSRLTAEKVRFLSMQLSSSVTDGVADVGSSDLKISMEGFGLNLSTVAFQSDVLNQLEQYGLRKIVKNPILSDPTQDDEKNLTSFKFSASIDPKNISYEKSVTTTGVPTEPATSSQ